jgi:exodeoxyribonuclease-5
MTIRVEDLTIGQKAALDTIVQMSHRPPGGIPETCVVAGPAGTGKTTLLKMVCDEIGPSHIVAPTGKAALRVRQATGYGATTIHKLLFKVVKDEATGEVGFTLKDPSEIGLPPSGFLIADEASMIDETLHDQMMVAASAVGMSVLFLGDLAQLPPVTPFGKSPFNILDPALYEATYRADLTEIVRQAAGDPLIQTSMYLRTNKVLDALKRLSSVPQEDLVDEAVGVIQRGGAVICHTNAVRNQLNRAIRAKLGYADEVVRGEPLVVNKNNYATGMFNGEIVSFKGWHTPPRGPYDVINKYTSPPTRQDCQFGRGFVQGVEGPQERVVMCVEEVFGTTRPEITHGAIATSAKRYWGKEDPVLHTNFGYVITCHKAQGSEWPEVLAVLDKVRMHTLDGRRWLYTAITRSKKQVRICMWSDT